MLRTWELLAKGGLLDDWSTNKMTLDFWGFTAQQSDEIPSSRRLFLISMEKWKKWKRDEVNLEDAFEYARFHSAR